MSINGDRRGCEHKRAWFGNPSMTSKARGSCVDATDLRRTGSHLKLCSAAYMNINNVGARHLIEHRPVFLVDRDHVANSKPTSWREDHLFMR